MAGLDRTSDDERFDWRPQSLSDDPRRQINEAMSAAEAADAGGRPDRAEAHYRDAVAHARAQADSWQLTYVLGRLGSFLHAQGDFDRAIEVCEEAVALGSDIPATFEALITIYGRLGRDDLFRVAEAYDARSGRGRTSILGRVIQLAVQQSKQGEHDLAERWLLRAEQWADRIADVSVGYFLGAARPCLRASR
jgi:tetratricopeptide (TPR) repeat protein